MEDYFYSKINFRIFSLNFKDSFEQLTEDEKSYIYYINQAIWAGAPILLFQVSYESPAIFILLQNFFSSFNSIKDLKSQILIKSKGTITDVEYTQFIRFAAKFYSNFGNYSSYGKMKFIPELPKEKFEEILSLSDKFNDFNYIWTCIRDTIYYDSPKCRTINLKEMGGENSYYLGRINKEQIEKIDKILSDKNISTINTRLMQINENKHAVLIASIENKKQSLEGDEIILLYGEFSPFLNKVNHFLSKAKNFVSNEIEGKLLDCYIESFKTGDIEKHKESQKIWLENKSPVIDMNIGWVEKYIDPQGVRGYYEGWVGIKDNWKSDRYAELVSNSKELLSTFPWSSDFEKEKLISIDFTALDVVGFASDCPTGLNVPKYNDIQETYGCKNISFRNAYPTFNNSNIQFCSDKDIETLINFGKQAMMITVACHHLLGHGSGKLLKKTENNSFNFDIENIINPLTNEKITSWYNENETYEQRFTSLAMTMEECRADLTGLFFCFNKKIYTIFEINQDNFNDIVYSVWLLYIRQAILGLPLYNTDNGKWGHAHTQGAWVFLKFILEEQKKDIEILKIELDEKKKTFNINLNKEMVCCFGQMLVEKILIKLHIWRCTGDVTSAREFFDKYSQVDEFFLKIRKIISTNEVPRRLQLFHNLKMNENNTVSIIEYPETFVGIIESFVDRYHNDLNKEIYDQWIKYATKNY